MSYCRWSSDDFACDLYCYGSSQGYETHVATNRAVGEIPKVGPFPDGDAPKEEWNAFAARHQAQLDWLGTCERVSIGGPHDGESFCDATAEEWLATLTMLRAAGYHFPDYVLDDARAEIADALSPAQASVSPSDSTAKNDFAGTTRRGDEHV